MSDNAIAITLQRIEKEAEEQTGTLNLQQLPLLGLPRELRALTHLRRLACDDTKIADLPFRGAQSEKPSVAQRQRHVGRRPVAAQGIKASCCTLLQ